MNKKDLAKKGRYGDTEIRKVDGQPAHVNPQEAKLIDRRGRLGEIIVKSIGTGTTNPETGLKEYPVDPFTIMQIIGTIVSTGAALWSAYQNNEMAEDKYNTEMDAWNEKLKAIGDQSELSWYQLEQWYGNQIFDINGDGKITQEDYDIAPAILQDQIGKMYGGEIFNIEEKE